MKLASRKDNISFHKIYKGPLKSSTLLLVKWQNKENVMDMNNIKMWINYFLFYFFTQFNFWLVNHLEKIEMITSTSVVSLAEILFPFGSTSEKEILGTNNNNLYIKLFKCLSVHDLIWISGLLVIWILSLS